MARNALTKWQELLRDPCAADLTAPIYGGTDVGYLVRTTDTYVPAFSRVVAAGATTADFVLEITPWNYAPAQGIRYGGCAPGLFFTVAAAGFGNNFINNNFTVKQFRPVAACMKFIPTGPITSRQGLVALGYSVGSPLTTGDTNVYPSSIRNSCGRIAANSSETHEVNWLPAPTDELFTSPLSTAPGNGSGAMILSLVNVDGQSSGTVTTINGVVEVTIVWEWVPLSTIGVTLQARTPSPYTLNQALAGLGDVNKVIYSMAKSGMAAAEMFGRVVRPYSTAHGLLGY